MPRPKTISSEQILDAARRLFLDQGYGASTAAIAREAGVSEGLVFKRFESKEKLFQESMGLPEWDAARGLVARVGTGDVRDHLVEIGLEVIDFLRILLPRTMHLCAHPSFDPVDALRNNPASPPVRNLRALAEYFEAEMRLGRITARDPEVVARMLMGSLHNYVFFEMIGVHASQPFPAPDYVRSLVEVLWHGLEPAGE